MGKLKPVVLGFLLWSMFACSDDMTGPEGDEFPEKLAPYETYYDAATFQQRRDDLVGSIPSDAMAVIVTNDTYLRNGDVGYEFRPASHFFYLTGFDEPNAVAVIRRKSPSVSTAELIMFVEKREGAALQWLGPVYGPEGAVEYFGADSAYEYENFVPLVRLYLGTGSYQSIYANFETNQTVADSFYSSGAEIPTVVDVNGIIEKMRVIKSPLEIDLIQQAVDVSVQAFTEALSMIEPGVYEYEVDALFDYILRLNGCSRAAFPTIVASGPNINILHYDENQRQMQAGELVMIDFGTEYGYYAADITRTLPVSGTFSPAQATIYGIVLEAYQTVVQAAAPEVSYYALYNLSRDLMLDRLLEKGIITGNKADLIATYSYRRYIQAGLAHPIGLDVHDPFPREESGDKILKENMVLALEPHIYLYEGDLTVDQDYWDVCARIEDDILITAACCEVLSAELPVEIEAIEKLMK
ncbi:MAG: aminopeptidase P N-terminal domain-containing protein [Fidelibacterota bacterium]|nr:MAG: aminopeptidase P N-terminal domain-containing protein [Candidatus Neomarinimicrobiota bacterium]